MDSEIITSLAQAVEGSCCAEVVVSEISCSGRWKGWGETMRGEGAHLVTRNLSSVNGRTMVSNLKVGVMNCDHKRATMGVIRGIGSNNLWAAFTHNGGGANVTRV